MTNQQLLDKLAEIEGYEDSMELLEANAVDSVVPAICRDCQYTEGMEPDQTRGWCPECNKNSMVSCMVLAGVI